MASQIVLALLFITGVAYAAHGNGRISGGSDTTIQAFPMAVQVDSLLYTVWSQTCAGSILTSRYVLSAASCYDDLLFSPLTRRVRFGTDKRNYGGELSAVETVIKHPNFGLEGRDADIALVRLSTVLSYTGDIQPGTITAADAYLPTGVPVTVIGWGNIDADIPAEVLQEVDSVTLDWNICNEIYSAVEDAEQVTPNMICVGDTETVGAGACAGDVGGPVIYKQDPFDIIVGVVSWANGCQNNTNPTVATAVTMYTEWILANAR